MPLFEEMFVVSLDAALSANARLSDAAPAARALGDTGLIDAQRSVAEARRHLDACASVLAGEVVRRSQPSQQGRCLPPRPKPSAPDSENRGLASRSIRSRMPPSESEHVANGAHSAATVSRMA